MEVIILNIKIATRKSKLALTQTEFIMYLIKKKYGLNSDKLLITTEGDRRLEVSLDKIGGKGLFVKDIEIALIENRAQAAVHSMKDVPFEIGDQFEIAAIPIREDVRDAFVSSKGVNFFDLPKGAKVGTSSKRRVCQIKSLRSDIIIVPMRGNIQTRINKMEQGDLDGVVLAAAGLKRLKLDNIITNYFDPLQFVPAIGQGALGIETMKDSEEVNYFRGLDNEDVRLCVEGERSFMRKLNGGCHAAIGAYATLNGEMMNITGIFVVNGKLVKKDVCGSKFDNIKLGEALGEKILLG